MKEEFWPVGTFLTPSEKWGIYEPGEVFRVNIERAFEKSDKVLQECEGPAKTRFDIPSETMEEK